MLAMHLGVETQITITLTFEVMEQYNEGEIIRYTWDYMSFGKRTTNFGS